MTITKSLSAATAAIAVLVLSSRASASELHRWSGTMCTYPSPTTNYSVSYAPSFGVRNDSTTVQQTFFCGITRYDYAAPWTTMQLKVHDRSEGWDLRCYLDIVEADGTVDYYNEQDTGGASYSAMTLTFTAPGSIYGNAAYAAWCSVPSRTTSGTSVYGPSDINGIYLFE